MKLVTYNVLADRYIRPEYYPHTPPERLTAAIRHPALVERVASFDADVICLQEVEGAIFSRLRGRLEAYQGHFLKKGSDKLDGCATFLRRPAAAAREVRYADDTGHIALLTESDFNGRRLGVANTHLKWGPPESTISREQAEQLLRELPPADGWVICGDFNAPWGSPALDAFKARGFVDAYGAVGGDTCNSNGVAKRIDFVLHSPSLRSRPLPLPAIHAATPLPSASEPSDHLAVGAVFEWI